MTNSTTVVELKNTEPLVLALNTDPHQLKQICTEWLNMRAVLIQVIKDCGECRGRGYGYGNWSSNSTVRVPCLSCRDARRALDMTWS